MPENPDTDILIASQRPYSVRVALTTNAVALGDGRQVLTELRLQADPDNTVNIVIGSATDQSWTMTPGYEITFPIRNPAVIWGKATGAGTANLNLLGRSS